MGEGRVLHAEIEKEVHSAEAEERNVGEAVHAPLEASVSTQPIGILKFQAKNHAAEEPQEDPEPGKDQVRMGGAAVHGKSIG